MPNYLTERELEQYVQEHNIGYAYCVECGKLLIYDSDTFYISKTGVLKDKKERVSFLKVRDYNGNNYRICRCKECVGKKFPEILTAKGLYVQKWAKSSQYAFGVPDEDFVELSKARQSITKEKMVKKYGEEEGNRRWNEYCSKQAKSNTFEYKQEKYGMTREEFDEYNQSRAVTLENMVSKYGQELGLQKYNEYVEKQSHSVTEEYFVEKYGPELGAEKYKNFNDKRTKII